MAGMSLEELRARSLTHHPACVYSPTGGNRVEENQIGALRATLQRVASECGYPADVGPGDRVAYDRRAASILHRDMRIVPADAAQPGVWAFLTCVVVPDVACWRFPRRTAGRLEGGPRNVLRRLWWRAHLLDSDGDDLVSRMGEDELVQIMERPESVLGNPRMARALAHAHLSVCADVGIGGRMRVLRDAAKRTLRLSAVISLDALDDPSLSRVAEHLLAESVQALGEGQPQHQNLEELQLLTMVGPAGPLSPDDDTETDRP
jgi:hypothetical protein